mmetsp:Transcript_8637/g.23407  ORF Transcript_8637/g.23407 Transcript_8637/m.23407 type:complete len:157 (+) Transcript_8637:1018-1488(+)
MRGRGASSAEAQAAWSAASTAFTVLPASKCSVNAAMRRSVASLGVGLAARADIVLLRGACAWGAPSVRARSRLTAPLGRLFFGRRAGAPGPMCAAPVARQYYAQAVCVALRLAVAAWGRDEHRQNSQQIWCVASPRRAAAARTINVLVALQRTCRS